MPIIEGASEYQYAGAPSAGVDAIYILTIDGTPTGGTFRLGYDGYVTAPIAWTDDDEDLVEAVGAALEALSSIGAGGVVVEADELSDGIGTISITMAGNLAKLAVPPITVVSNLIVDETPPALDVEETVKGVAPVDEVQTLTIGGAPDGGTFQLGFGDQTSGNITWSATNATLLTNILTALNALSNIESGDVLVEADDLTDGVGTITITFATTLAATDVPLISVEDNSLTGEDATVDIDETVKGAAAVDEVQTLTISEGPPTGGTFKLGYGDEETDEIEWTDNDETLVTAVSAALKALDGIGASDIVVAEGDLTDGVGTITITFEDTLAATDVPLISIADNSLTGTVQTLDVSEDTEGVSATMRGARIGAKLHDTTNGKIYTNTGTALEPVWTLVGAQE